MDVARLNLSHGAHAEHERIYQRIRTAAAETGQNVGILVDLQGPKIRLAEFAEGKVTLTYGERFTITTREVPGDVTICGTTYDGLPGDVKPGDPLLIDDGRIGLVAEEVTETDVICRVTVGGPVSRSACRRCRRRTSRTCAGPCTCRPT
jgi:pyruvate kinase